MSADSKPLVVVADDDPDVTTMVAHLVRGWGYRAAASGNKAELLAQLARERPALVLLDLRFGDTDGMDLLRQLLDASPDLAVALLTGHGSIDVAVTAMRLGAYDFLTKPPDTNRLRVLIAHAAEKQALAARVHKLESLVAAAPPGLRLLGESPAMRQAVGLIRSVAPTDATVLVLGESGTGKELAARTVHDLSRRAGGPFVPLNMAALPRELAESLLFGHEKGAFTGADRAQAGACELANKGTLFLDEMGEMDLGLQSKLLRFLQERSVQRVGSPKAVAVDVRVVAATNRDLAERVRGGLFREDLYYRLNVVPITLPPLRDRREDISALAARFLQAAMLKYRRDGLTFTPAALDALTTYNWPGNVRQLENVTERLVILNPGPVIGPEALADEFRTNRVAAAAPPPPAAVPVSVPVPPAEAGADRLRLVDQIEKQAIIETLVKVAGSVREVSHVLGWSQATVYRKIKRYGINLAHYARPVG